MMKKYFKFLFLFGILIGLIFIAIITNKDLKKNTQQSKLFNNITFNSSENPYMYYELEDRYIYTRDMIDTISFTYNNETKELSSWFQEEKDFLNIFLAEIARVSSKVIENPNDGGTKEYHDGNIGIVVCHTYDNNINIILGKNLDYKKADCYSGKKILVKEKAKNDKVLKIIDKSKYYDNIDYLCTGEEKTFYEDENHKYTFGCKSVVVIYESGFEESAEEAFISGSINLADLDKFGIQYTIKK